MKKIQFFLMPLLLILSQPTWLSAQTKIELTFNKPGADIKPAMRGIFFEDINFALDGSIYAEMVKKQVFCFRLI